MNYNPYINRYNVRRNKIVIHLFILLNFIRISVLFQCQGFFNIAIDIFEYIL